MFEFLLEIIWVVFDVPRYTGKFLVFVFTLGRVQCEDGLATVIGWTFWIGLLIALAIILAR
jgi:hypothetical protein